MPKRTGVADLPLHTGTVPRWLADRMRDLGRLIAESIVENYGKREFLVRLSDPLWFQSFGAVMGMDWHSSGITTSVMYALKRGLNPIARDLGIYVCGGRGKFSRETPNELLQIADKTGVDGYYLKRTSCLCAKVDNTAVQDGFQLYQHNFIVTDEGDWAVVQQGMNTGAKAARRYHWCSSSLRSFVEEPHAGVVGENRGQILNLTHQDARSTRSSILELTHENPDRMMREIQQIVAPNSSVIVSPQMDLFAPPESQLVDASGNPLSSAAPWEIARAGMDVARATCRDPIIANSSRDCIMPNRHEVRAEDVDLKRLGGVLATAYESDPKDFESLLLTPGLGPRTLQSLTLVSEVINGTPSRFRDPARYSFAHGGKDGHPFPVPTRVYDESIRVLKGAIEHAKIGDREKMDCLNRLHATQLAIEKDCEPLADFDKTLEHERSHSIEWGGRTV
ncbi:MULTISPECIES: DUF763 domain-containing protein [unclassified Fibrobacter]|uniref:DUF763 domain-containing protein n=1 Tax=unclassified Fibrobacter TaxID=2634177 RepID=UPI000D6D1E37|nr:MULTISPECIES: DUF763 domain-containing protein [unclassified Fibrobacter]PWJ68307.1 hypothetical protein BGX12_10832 [Fibrobacter sp. UWR4]PZW65641.1 hypothetical protein C8E88_103032 [Fibrobacter sp. UWR1]